MILQQQLNYLESVFSLNMVFILVLPRIGGNGDTQESLKGMLVEFSLL